MKIQIEEMQLETWPPIYIAWPLDADAARWLRDTNLGAVQRWGDVVAIRWDWLIDFLDVAGSCDVEIEHVEPPKQEH